MSLRDELTPTLRLAVPVVLAELGWMGMGVVDTVMVAPLGPSAIGAVGIGSSLLMAFAIFGMGVLLGLDTLVSQAFGARAIDDCHRWLRHGVALALLMTVPVVAVCFAVLAAIPWLGFHPEVMPLLQAYFSVVLWSTPFLLLYAACRRYLQGMHRVTPVMFALVSANLINAAANWGLIHGHFGLPRLGVAGAAWATLLSRIYMFAVLGVTIWVQRGSEGFRGVQKGSEGFGEVLKGSEGFGEVLKGSGGVREVLEGSGLGRQDRRAGKDPWWGGVEWARLWRLLELGLPAASQVTAEVGVFALATVMAGMLDPVSIASHQIAINLAAVAFMVPLGIASAGAVRVGHAVGARDAHRAAASGWTAIALGTAFMLASGLVFFAVPRALIGLFTRDQAVLALGTSLLYIAAVFQLFDGLQGVATGTLRGLGDTRTPMMANLAAHWLLGLPVSYTLCFVMGWGVRGLWWGLSLGLIVTGVVLIRVWQVKIRRHLAD